MFAVGTFLVTFGAFQGIPVTMNYTSECFRQDTVEAVIPLMSMRLFFGLTINFYIDYWVEKTGVSTVMNLSSALILSFPPVSEHIGWLTSRCDRSAGHMA